MKIIQLTDTHLFANDSDMMHGVCCNAAFDETIRYLINHDLNDTDMIFLTGDISQDMTEKSYHKISESLSHLKIPVYWIPGNHDDNTIAESVFSKYKFFKRQNHLDSDHWYFIFLDSTIKNSHAGYLSEEQLSLLKSELSCAPPNKKIAIALHHHPIETQTPLIDEYILQNKNEFWGIVLQHSVSLIICGHVHGDYQIKHKGVIVEASPATCLQWKKGAITLDMVNEMGYKIYQFNGDYYSAYARLLKSCQS